MADFGSLNTALSGLMAHRRATEVIGHNLANVNTEGYSRQRVELTGASAGIVPAIFSRTDRPGGGVNVSSQFRVRDEFLERRALTETANSASLRRQGEAIERVESAFPEPSDTGIASQLADYWSSWDDVVNQPDSVGARSQLIERGITLSDSFNRVADELANLRGSSVSALGATVADINASAARVAELNGAIRNAVAADLHPNDLMDQRDLLIHKLAGMAGVTATDGEFGSINVTIGGTQLVHGDRSERLKVAETTVNPPTPEDQPSMAGWPGVQIQWERDSYPATVTGGQLDGVLKTVNDMLPRHQQQVDALAAQLATQTNAVHTTGFGLDGVGGRNFYAAPPAGPPSIGAAAGLRVDPGMLGHPEHVGVSSLATPAGNLDVSVGQQLSALQDSPTGVDAAYQAFIGRMGVESQTVQRRSAIQDEVTQQVDTSRLSVSAVSIDEEMISLTQSQHAYSAAARLMTAIDSMIDTLINRTGQVGR